MIATTVTRMSSNLVIQPLQVNRIWPGTGPGFGRCADKSESLRPGPSLAGSGSRGGPSGLASHTVTCIATHAPGRIAGLGSGPRQPASEAAERTAAPTPPRNASGLGERRLTGRRVPRAVGHGVSAPPAGTNPSKHRLVYEDRRRGGVPAAPRSAWNLKDPEDRAQAPPNVAQPGSAGA